MTSLITTSEPLRTRFRGALLHPGEDGYEQARRTWNGAIDRRPRLIARCAGADDVQHALGFARERDLPVTVRGGGHSVMGHAVDDDAVMIDLSLMKGVAVDPATRIARAAGGVLWSELDLATQRHGLATTGGTVSHVERGREAVALGGEVELAHAQAGGRADHARRRVHRDRLHQRQVDHHRPVAHAVAGDGVPAAAHGDLEPALAGEAQGGLDVVGAGAAGDQGGEAVDRAVEGPARLGVALLPRSQQGAAEAPAQRTHGGAARAGRPRRVRGCRPQAMHRSLITTMHSLCQDKGARRSVL